MALTAFLGRGVCASCERVYRVGVWTHQGMAVGGSIGAFLQLPLLLFVQLTQLLSFKS